MIGKQLTPTKTGEEQEENWAAAGERRLARLVDGRLPLKQAWNGLFEVSQIWDIRCSPLQTCILARGGERCKVSSR